MADTYNPDKITDVHYILKEIQDSYTAFINVVQPGPSEFNIMDRGNLENLVDTFAQPCPDGSIRVHPHYSFSLPANFPQRRIDERGFISRYEELNDDERRDFDAHLQSYVARTRETAHRFCKTHPCEHEPLILEMRGSL
jgi:hypothetical protein